MFAKLIERENVQSTAVGNGVAIPHCLNDAIPDLLIDVARSLESLEFNFFDGKPTHVVFLLIGNSQEYSLHGSHISSKAGLSLRGSSSSPGLPYIKNPPRYRER